MKYITLLLLFFVFGCEKNTTKLSRQDYPKIDKVTVTDNYFGITLKDDYRQLENLQDSITIDWFKNQDDFTETILSSYIDNTQSVIKKQIKDNLKVNGLKKSKLKYATNNSRFFLQKSTMDDVSKLYYQVSKDSSPVELFNPSNFQEHLKIEYTISYLQPSWDGKHVVIALSHDGNLGAKLIVIDVINKKVLPQIITNADPEYFLGISWLPNSEGFTYLYLPEIDDQKDEYMQNSSTVLYKLGEDPNNRHIIFSNTDSPDLTIDDFPIAKILSPNDRYIIGYQASSENYWEAYYAEMDGLENDKLKWKPFYKKDEKIYADYGYFLDDEFVFITGKNADNRAISSFKIEDVGQISQTVLAKEKEDEVISSLIISNSTPYYTTTKFGVESFLYEIVNEEDNRVQLPYIAGDIQISSASNESSMLLVGLDSWARDNTKYEFSNGKFKLASNSSANLYPAFKDFVVQEVTVQSHDGVEVPLSLIHRKDLKKNGSNPTFIYSYGAYGESIKPFFSSIFLNWVYNGGIFAIPHIRGGGEKGDDWHRQGMKTLKYNSWKDIIACTEYLIENNYTSESKTVLYSSSAGAVSTGMAMIEKPNLFKVFIADVPMLNPLRNEVRKQNGSNHLEYGTVNDSIECMSLIAMDPYVNLKPQTKYPASLIISSNNDSRIDAWIPGKFTAKMQECNINKVPVLLDIVYDSGHEGGDTLNEQVEEYARMFAFAFWQTDHPIRK